MLLFSSSSLLSHGVALQRSWIQQRAHSQLPTGASQRPLWDLPRDWSAWLLGSGQRTRGSPSLSRQSPFSSPFLFRLCGFLLLSYELSYTLKDICCISFTLLGVCSMSSRRYPTGPGHLSSRSTSPLTTFSWTVFCLLQGVSLLLAFRFLYFLFLEWAAVLLTHHKIMHCHRFFFFYRILAFIAFWLSWIRCGRAVYYLALLTVSFVERFLPSSPHLLKLMFAGLTFCGTCRLL